MPEAPFRPMYADVEFFQELYVIDVIVQTGQLRTREMKSLTKAIFHFHGNVFPVAVTCFQWPLLFFHFSFLVTLNLLFP